MRPICELTSDEDASRRFADCKGLAECGFLEMELDEYAEQISRAYHHRYGGDSQAEGEKPAEDSGQEIVHEERLADNPVDGAID